MSKRPELLRGLYFRCCVSDFADDPYLTTQRSFLKSSTMFTGRRGDRNTLGAQSRRGQGDQRYHCDPQLPQFWRLVGYRQRAGLEPHRV
jgi:hypothetical protein